MPCESTVHNGTLIVITNLKFSCVHLKNTKLYDFYKLKPNMIHYLLCYF